MDQLLAHSNRPISRRCSTAVLLAASLLCAVGSRTLAAAPAAPSGLISTAASQTQITLSWADNSGDESGFKIERSADGSTGWTQIGTVGANVSTYPNTGLVANALWYYRVRAWNGSGDSGYSNTANTHTAYATEYGGTAVWRSLLMVYANTDADYTQGGVPKHYTGSMNATYLDDGIWAFHQYISLANELSDREGIVLGDVVLVPNPISHVTDMGGEDYWVAPSNIASDIDTYAPAGSYDSILVYWSPGSIPRTSLGLAIGASSDANGATYCQIYEWDGWHSEGKDGEAWLHEWGHGMSDHMGDLGHRRKLGLLQ